MDLITDARDLALTKLAFEMPQLWRHVEAAAKEAERIAPAFGADATVLVTTAWLHDIGHAPELAQTGFPPLDAARFLRDEQWLPRLVDLVAYHSGSAFEADSRGLHNDLAEFADEATPTRDALWYCDLTTGANGERVDIDDRVAEITARYGTGELATRLADKARQELTGAVRRTEKRLKAARL